LTTKVKERVLIAADTKVITALFAIEVVIERALLTVFKKDADEASSTDQNRGHFLDHDSTTPFSVMYVSDFIPKAEIETMLSLHIRS
jgi:hypothetical protein